MVEQVARAEKGATTKIAVKHLGSILVAKAPRFGALAQHLARFARDGFAVPAGVAISQDLAQTCRVEARSDETRHALLMPIVERVFESLVNPGAGALILRYSWPDGVREHMDDTHLVIAEPDKERLFKGLSLFLRMESLQDLFARANADPGVVVQCHVPGQLRGVLSNADIFEGAYDKWALLTKGAKTLDDVLKSTHRCLVRFSAAAGSATMTMQLQDSSLKPNEGALFEIGRLLAGFDRQYREPWLIFCSVLDTQVYIYDAFKLPLMWRAGIWNNIAPQGDVAKSASGAAVEVVAGHAWTLFETSIKALAIEEIVRAEMKRLGFRVSKHAEVASTSKGKVEVPLFSAFRPSHRLSYVRSQLSWIRRLLQPMRAASVSDKRTERAIDGVDLDDLARLSKIDLRLLSQSALADVIADLQRVSRDAAFQWALRYTDLRRTMRVIERSRLMIGSWHPLPAWLPDDVIASTNELLDLNRLFSDTSVCDVACAKVQGTWLAAQVADFATLYQIWRTIEEIWKKAADELASRFSAVLGLDQEAGWTDWVTCHELRWIVSKSQQGWIDIVRLRKTYADSHSLS